MVISGKPTNGRGGARHGSGPKPMRPGDRRRNRVVINLTDGELNQVVKAAKGEHLGGFARRILLRSVARQKK
jgi:hypothetical protein